MAALETVVEGKYVSWVDEQGYDAIKINKLGWPDRLTILDFGYSFYIEFKRKGKRKHFGKRQGETYQSYIHKKLREKGTHVYLVETLEEAKKVFTYEVLNNTSKDFKELKI